MTTRSFDFPRSVSPSSATTGPRSRSSSGSRGSTGAKSVPIDDVIATSEESTQTRVLRPRRAAPADAVRPTRAEINLQALRHNLRVLQKHAGTASVWPVLKADGYGHGAPAVARTLERARATGFCVALLEEAIELREAGIVLPILVMGGYYGDAHEELVARRLTPVVYDITQVEGFARVVRSRGLGQPVDVHVKVDTGMARLGLTLDRVAAFAEALAAYPEVRVGGLMTHLACAELEGEEATAEQVTRFNEATAIFAKHGIHAPVRHAANSAALLKSSSASFEMTRPGIAIFGCDPRFHTASHELRGVMRVRSEIIDLRTVPTGGAVGYGALWRAARPSSIATVPIGYADGLLRQLTNRGEMLVRGRRVPIVGAVSMDMTMLDVTDVPFAGLRDEVVVLGAQDGPQGKENITVHEIADAAGAIPWEVLTSISRRVPRFYREP